MSGHGTSSSPTVLPAAAEVEAKASQRSSAACQRVMSAELKLLGRPMRPEGVVGVMGTSKSIWGAWPGGKKK